MFCPECGKENSDKSTYCAECGAKLVDNSGDLGSINTFDFDRLKSDLKKVKDSAKKVIDSAGEKVKEIDTQEVREKAEKNKKSIVLAGAIGILIIALIIFFSVGKSLTSPEKVAENYFEALKDGNYEKMFSYIDVNESEFINGETFAKYYENTYDSLGQIYNFTIRNDNYDGYDGEDYGNMNNDSFVQHYVVSYNVQGSSIEDYFPITITKLGTKKALFFDDYKVALDSIIAENVTVYAPAGCPRVTMDGIELTRTEKASEATEWKDKYTLDKIFNGRHEFRLDGEAFMLYCTDGEPYAELYTDSVYEIPALLGSSFNGEKLTEEVTPFVKAIFSGASINKKFSELGIKDPYGKIEYAYNEICEDFENVDNLKVTGVSYEECSINGFVDLEVEFTYTYSYVYTDWFGETTEESRSDYNYVDVNLMYDTEGNKFIPVGFDY